MRRIQQRGRETNILRLKKKKKKIHQMGHLFFGVSKFSFPNCIHCVPGSHLKVCPPGAGSRTCCTPGLEDQLVLKARQEFKLRLAQGSSGLEDMLAQNADQIHGNILIYLYIISLKLWKKKKKKKTCIQLNWTEAFCTKVTKEHIRGRKVNKKDRRHKKGENKKEKGRKN